MKKHILLLFSFLCLFLSARAQYKMVITLNDGTTYTQQVWDIKNVTFEPSGTIDKPDTAEAVDLGLSVKWAAQNFGAKTATDLGYYIGWGDATGLNNSTVLNYFPVLNPSADIVNTNYDIVHVLWGKQWRMPTVSEIKELIDGCTWTYDESKKGWTVTSKKDNTKSIFLPIVGFRLGTKTVAGSGSAYWSGSLCQSDNTLASVLAIDPTSYTTADSIRYLGLPIRPVYGPYYEGATVKDVKTTNFAKTDAYVQVKFAGNYSDASEIGLAYGTTSNIDPDQNTKLKAAVTSIGSDSTYTFHIENLTPNTKYYYLAYIVYQSKRNTSATQNFTTLPKFPIADMVDMGLSVKWAKWNIGASSESEYGSYIAWGDPTGENSSYVNDDYPNDMSDISGTKYDVATTQWGGEWRMPTPTEWKELDSLTTKELVTIPNSSIKAFKVTSKINGNVIYLPRGGYETKNGLSSAGNEADYWTSENTAQSWAKGVMIGMINSTYEPNDGKGWHMLIRPVYGKQVDPNKPIIETKDTTEAGKAAQSVDLGLSVKWATYNLGATSSSEAGSYFSWGSVEPESAGYDFSRANHPWYKDGTFTVPATAIENTDYDAASTLWGGTWRMPTDSEIKELVNNCTWTKTATGFTVKGPNGNKIFLPFTGLYSGTSLSGESQCYYWSSTYNTLPSHADDYWAQYLATNSKYAAEVLGNYIYKGMCIRPVRP